MRRGYLIALTLLPVATMALAQTVTPAQQTRLFLAGPVLAPVIVDVAARVMSFDSDNDGRVAKAELPERMHNLLLGDRNNDGALDRSEIEVRSLATAVPIPATVPGFAGGGGGGYTFGDQVSLSTRSHVEGALDDLRLGAPAKEQALAIVRTFMDTLETDAAGILMSELKPLLTPSQLDSLEVALNQQMTSRVAGSNVVTANDGGKKIFRFFGGPDLALRIHQFGLSPEETEGALAALEGFKTTIRPGDAERTELLARLTDVLSDEERENFGAALARRPLVKASGVMAGMVQLQKLADQTGGVVGGAVFRMPSPPQPIVLEP